MRSKPMILAALLLAAFLVNLDTTLVNVALPAMVRQLHATTTELEWVVDAYNLVFAALLLIFGGLSDRFGRKGRDSDPPLPARGAAGLRGLRAAAGISLVQRQARLPLPARLHVTGPCSLCRSRCSGHAVLSRNVRV